MKLLIVLITTILLLGCGENPDYSVYETTTLKGSKEAAAFIIDCGRAANPMSDEEGEDLIAQCQRTANDIYGVPRFYGYTHKYVKGCYSSTRGETISCLVEVHEGKD